MARNGGFWGSDGCGAVQAKQFFSGNFHKRLTLFHSRADGGFNFRNFSAAWREDKRVHLHRFERQQVIAFFDGLSDADNDSRHATGERTGDIARTSRT